MAPLNTTTKRAVYKRTPLYLLGLGFLYSLFFPAQRSGAEGMLARLLRAGEEESTDEEEEVEEEEGEGEGWALAAHAELRSVHEALAQSASRLREREADLARREAVLAERERGVGRGRALNTQAATAIARAGEAAGAAEAAGYKRLAEAAEDEALLRQLLQEEAARLTARTSAELEARADARVRQLEKIVDDLRRRYASLAAQEAAAQRRARTRQQGARRAAPPSNSEGARGGTSARETDLRQSRSFIAALLPLWSEASHTFTLNDEALSGAVVTLASLPLASPTATVLLRLLWHEAARDGDSAPQPPYMFGPADLSPDGSPFSAAGEESHEARGMAISQPMWEGACRGQGRAQSAEASKRPPAAAAGAAGCKGARWERHLFQYLCTALEPSRLGPLEVPASEAAAPQGLAVGAKSERVAAPPKAAAPTRLLAAHLLLRISLRHPENTGNIVGGAHAHGVLVALRVLHSLSLIHI